MAISCGQLIKQAWTDNAKRRTFHYRLSIATPPQDVAVVVGEHAACCGWTGFLFWVSMLSVMRSAVLLSAAMFVVVVKCRAAL